MKDVAAAAAVDVEIAEVAAVETVAADSAADVAVYGLYLL